MSAVNKKIEWHNRQPFFDFVLNLFEQVIQNRAQLNNKIYVINLN